MCCAEMLFAFAVVAAALMGFSTLPVFPLAVTLEVLLMLLELPVASAVECDCEAAPGVVGFA